MLLLTIVLFNFFIQEILDFIDKMIRINRNTDLISIHDLMFDVNIVIDIGNNSLYLEQTINKRTVTVIGV